MKKIYNHHVVKGFSLVEISIVLVILGLLVGSILSGQSLIRASQLRSVTTEYNQYRAAAANFRDKYFYLPGDMPNATKFWGVAAAGLACRNVQPYATKTCDGDGNGYIVWSVTGASGTQTFELFRFWQHLVNAGLLQGGQVVSVGTTTYGGGRIGPWTVGSVGTVAGGTGNTIVDFTTNTNLVLGAPSFNGDYGNAMQQSVPISPKELWNIDTKIDDGKPASGIAVAGDIGGCTDSSSNLSNLTANYMLTSDDTSACYTTFRRIF